MAIVENQMVEVKWNTKNRHHYEGLGFTWMTNSKTLNVKVEQLPANSCASIKLKCDSCGIDYNQRYKYIQGKTNHFCTRECYYDFRRANGSHNNTQVEVSCYYCGDIFKVPQYRHKLLMEDKISSITCSRMCQNRLIGLHHRGENHPGFKGSKNIECQICNTEFNVPFFRETTAKYCSVDCQRIGVGRLNVPKKKVEVNCYTCGKTHERWEYEYKKYQYHFCSNYCRNESAGVLISLQKGNFDTQIQVIVNSMLNKLNVTYVNEKAFGRYCVDNYIVDGNLIIEVMGDYWHSNPNVYQKYDQLNDTQKNRVKMDKSKKTFIRNKHDINILYLWENDIHSNAGLCEALIKMYIDNHGVLEDYNSFNYTKVDKTVKLNKNIVLPYFLQRNTPRQI